MSLKYKLSARTSPHDLDAEAKIYAGAVNSGTLSMEEICSNIERNSTATRGDVKGIALAFANYLIKSLTAGNSVYLEDLGFFRVGCSSKGAETESKNHIRESRQVNRCSGRRTVTRFTHY